jgi:transposase-like protein
VREYPSPADRHADPLKADAAEKPIELRNYALDKVALNPYLTGRIRWASAMLTLNQVSVLSEDKARETIERILWPNGPVCAHCGAVENVTRLQGEAHRPGVFQCNNCHEQFTVTVGTIFEDSHLPLRKWLMAFALLCSAKKGISALQLQRELDIGSYRTAWHLAHRIRHAMSKEPLAELLKGTVEVDETYVGGKPRPGAGEKPKRGRGTKKTPVVALVEREGRVRAHRIEHVDAATLKGAIRENVDRKSRIMTDDWHSYNGIETEFEGGHEVVTHSAGEYARGEAYTNTAESFFALRSAASSARSITSASSISTVTATNFRSVGIIARSLTRPGRRS